MIRESHIIYLYIFKICKFVIKSDWSLKSIQIFVEGFSPSQ